MGEMSRDGDPSLELVLEPPGDVMVWGRKSSEMNSRLLSKAGAMD